MSFRRLDQAEWDRYSSAHRIDIICDAFEQAWQAEETPRIEDFLDEVTSREQPALLHELLATEFEYRRKRQEAVALEPYLERFPRFSDVVRLSHVTPATEMTHAVHSMCEYVAGAEIDVQHPTRHLFSAVPVDVLNDRMDRREFAAGEYLLREGEVGSSLMVVLDGLVDVSTVDQSGKTHVIGHVGRGQLLGEMSLLTAQPCTANAVAVDQVRVLALPFDVFHELARQYPELSVVMTNVVASRLGQPGRDALTDKFLDRYQIKGRLGRGGMGIVYEAKDSQSHDSVALKMLNHRLVYSPEALERFRREADIIASFEHPNIVRLLRRFAAFHTYFIVMEFCRGRNLQEQLESNGALSIANFHSLIGQLASALKYAHRADIVHRDIKPANIVLTPEGTLKLMDFGLAEPVSELTGQSGGVFGTPRFMAPEQRRGRSTGRAADYFALGCVAYEMLCGEPLFNAGTMGELRRDFASWQPPDLKRLRPELPDETCRHLQPALEKDPARRRLDLGHIATWT